MRLFHVNNCNISINNRIQKLIDLETGGNKRAFAKRIGVTASVIENIVGKRKSTPSYTVIEKISQIDKLNLNWIINGVGNIYLDVIHQETKEQHLDSVNKEKLKNLLIQLQTIEREISMVLGKL